MIKDFLTYLSAERAYSVCTINSYEEDLKQFKVFFQQFDEELSWFTIDKDIIRNWVIEQMNEGLSATTVNRRLSTLRSFYRYLMMLGKISVNPASMVKGPKKKKPLPQFVREREMDDLFDKVIFNSDFVGVRDRTILLLFYSTGVRVSELINLHLSSIDFSKMQLKVLGKRNKERIIPFGDELKEELLHYIQQSKKAFPNIDPSFLFLSRKGTKMNAPMVSDLVKKYLSKVSTVKKKTPHVLRHTFATAMLNNHAELEVVQELLGHESLATTEIYTHTTFEELKKEYKHAHPRA